jgi:hypothetical protein
MPARHPGRQSVEGSTAARMGGFCGCEHPCRLGWSCLTADAHLVPAIMAWLEEMVTFSLAR